MKGPRPEAAVESLKDVRIGKEIKISRDASNPNTYFLWNCTQLQHGMRISKKDLKALGVWVNDNLLNNGE